MRSQLTLALLCYTLVVPAFTAPAPIEKKSTAPTLSLRIQPSAVKVSSGQQLTWEVALLNCGRQAVTVVQPGDGSDCGWRTPIIEWTVDGLVKGEKKVEDKKTTKEKDVQTRPQ